jgi:SOS-response transcriptional repressor LexA
MNEQNTREEILAAIRSHQAETGFCPSVREVAVRVKRSTTRVCQLLEQLKTDGRVTWTPKLSRTLRVL